MATLRDIRNRILGVKSIEKITSAMKMVSSIKSRRSQKQIEAARPYFRSIEKKLISLNDSEEIANNDNKLLRAKNEVIKNVAILIVAGDKGMCGAFNNGLFKEIDAYLAGEFKELYPGATPHLILFGTKTVEHYKKKKHNVIGEFSNAFQSLKFSVVEAIHSTYYDNFLIGDIDRVEIFYNRFVNVMKQVPTRFQLLPIEIKKDLTEKESDNSNSNTNYIFEPDKKTLLDTLINQYLDWNIWGPILESNAAEQAARLIAMDKATQNAQELIKDLELQYNNARQAAITTEMLEIVGGAEALKK